MRRQAYDGQHDRPRLHGKGKYVFVFGGKVYQISDQSDKALATHASHTVVLTGTMKGDTITVSNIAMPNKK